MEWYRAQVVDNKLGYLKLDLTEETDTSESFFVWEYEDIVR